jgi:hypothetical protein
MRNEATQLLSTRFEHGGSRLREDYWEMKSICIMFLYKTHNIGMKFVFLVKLFVEIQRLNHITSPPKISTTKVLTLLFSTKHFVNKSQSQIFPHGKSKLKSSWISFPPNFPKKFLHFTHTPINFSLSHFINCCNKHNKTQLFSFKSLQLFLARLKTELSPNRQFVWILHHFSSPITSMKCKEIHSSFVMKGLLALEIMEQTLQYQRI